MDGTHAIIDAYGDISLFDSNQLLLLMEAAAHAAGATVLCSKVHEFGEGCGHTGVVLLAESHISVHTWPEEGFAAFDIFMCGQANVALAVDVLKAAVADSARWEIQILPRGKSRRAMKIGVVK